MDLTTPLSQLPPTRAPYIEDYFIDGQTMRVRNGSRIFSTYAAGSSTFTNAALGVYTNTSGTQALFGCVDDNSTLRVIDYSAASGSSVTSGTIPSNPATAYPIQFRTMFYVFDGNVEPITWDGSTWSVTGFTGTGLTESNLIAANGYRGRLYMVEKNSTKIWYPNTVEAMSGACKFFDVGSLLKDGGKVLNVFRVGYGDNRKANQYLAILTNQGEVLFYGGAYPESSDWELVGCAKIGVPLSARAFCFFQGDCLVATETGLASLRGVLAATANGQLYETASKPIDPYWKALVSAIKTVGTAADLAKTRCAYLSTTGCIYVQFYNKLSRAFNKLTTASVNPAAIWFVYNTNNGAWTFYNPSTSMSDLVEFRGKLIAAPFNTKHVREHEKPNVFNDENTASPGSYLPITGNILSSAYTSRSFQGLDQKTNEIALFGFFNLGVATAKINVALVENFGKTLTDYYYPEYSDGAFNALKMPIGGLSSYSQYTMNVITDASSGEPTTLYSLGILSEQGSFN